MSGVSGRLGFGETPEAALAEAQISLDLAVETYQEEGWSLPEAQAVGAAPYPL